MICPDCGMRFSKAEERADFNAWCPDVTFSYDDLPYPMCCECGKKYHEAMYGDAEEQEEDPLKELYREIYSDL